MLFCNWLSETGHSGLCASFWFHLDSELIAGQYHHSPVDHLEPDSPVGSSIFLSVGRLDRIKIPIDPDDHARTGDMLARYLGQADVDDVAGLL